MMTKLSQLQGINQGVINGITQLSQALSTFKAPSATAIKNVEALFAVIKSAGSGGTSMMKRVTELSAAFANLRVPTQGQIARLVEFFNAMGSAKGGANTSAIVRGLDSIAMAATQAAHSVAQLVGNLNQLRTGPLRGITGQANTATRNLQGFNNQLSLTGRLAGNTIGTLQGLGGAFAFATIVRAGANMESIRATFEGISGSSEKAAKSISFVQKVSNEAGVSFGSVAREYAKFSVAAEAAGQTTEEVNTMFEQIIKSSRIMGLSSDEAAGTLKALQQMFSKGKIQAEELRGQLGDRLPAAMNIMAKAVGVTTAELDAMMKRGELGTENIKKFTAALYEAVGGNDAFAKSADTLNATFGRLQNLFLTFSSMLIDAGLGDALKTIADALEDAFARGEYTNMITVFGAAAKVAGEALAILAHNLDLVVASFAVLKAVKVAQLFSTFAANAVSAATAAGTLSASAGLLGRSLTILRAVGTSLLTVLGGVPGLILTLGGLFLTLVTRVSAVEEAYNKYKDAAIDFNEITQEATKRLNEFEKATVLAGAASATVRLRELDAEIQKVIESARQGASQWRPWFAVQDELKNLGFTTTQINSLKDANKFLEEWTRLTKEKPKLMENREVEVLFQAAIALAGMSSEQEKLRKEVTAGREVLERQTTATKQLTGANQELMIALMELQAVTTNQRADGQARISYLVGEVDALRKGTKAHKEYVRSMDEMNRVSKDLETGMSLEEAQKQEQAITNLERERDKLTEANLAADSAAKKMGASEEKAYDQLIFSMTEYIDKQQAAREAIGMSASETEALNEQHRIDLFIMEKKIDRTDELNAKIAEHIQHVKEEVEWTNLLNEIYSETDAANQSLNDRRQALLDEQAALQMVISGEAESLEIAKEMLEIRTLLETKGWGEDKIKAYLEEQKKLKAGNDAMADQLKRQKELADDLGNAFESAFKRAILQGDNLLDVLSELAMAIAEAAWKQSFFPIISDYLGSTASSILTPHAKGGLITQPTLLATASAPSGYGTAGEKGTEAIMPLMRGPDGNLGVASYGGGDGSGGAGSIVIAPTMYINVQGSGDEAKDNKLAANVGKSINDNLRMLVRDELQKQARPGGFFKPAYGAG